MKSATDRRDATWDLRAGPGNYFWIVTSQIATTGLSVLSVWMAPDGRSVAAVVAGVPVILDAGTLIPRARLELEPGASLEAWTS